MNRDLLGMEVLVRVVEKRGFSAAAQSLNLTPSAVSKHISRMEADLGVRLLNRSTHELSLTEAGKLFHAHCMKIMREIEIAREAVHETSEGLTGTLKLHVTPGTGRQFVLPSLRRFMKQHPKLTVDLTIAPEAIDIVQHGLDLSIRSGTERDIGLQFMSVECRQISLAPYLICASPEYFRRHKRPREPKDLANHDCLLYVGQPSFDKWWFTNGHRRYGVVVKGHFRANDWAAIYEAALEGLGIARLLAIKPEVRTARQKLITLFAKETLYDRAIWAVYPRDTSVPRKVTAFLNFLTAELTGK